MNILNNVGSIFTDLYWHYYKDVPKEAMFERSVVERIKLRKKGLHEIKGTEQNINNELHKSSYFTNYQSPSSIPKNKQNMKRRNK